MSDHEPALIPISEFFGSEPGPGKPDPPLERLCDWLVRHMPTGNWLCRPCYWLTLVAPEWMWYGRLRMWIAWRAWGYAVCLPIDDHKDSPQTPPF